MFNRKQQVFKSASTLKFAVTSMFLAVTAFFMSTQATANQIIPFTDDWFNRQYDWVIYVGLSPMDKFLKYPNSTMTPIMRVPVQYRFTPRMQRKNYTSERRNYEELWYHDGKAVGLRRYENLNLGMDEQGALYFQPDTKLGESIRETTNTMVRLVMDIYARRSILATIIVPKEYFESYASALSQFNFFKLTMVYPGGPGNNMSLHLQSQPFGLERYFYYDDAGRR